MKKIAVRIVAGLAIAVLASYAADYAVLRYRIFRSLAPYDTVTVRYYYEVQEKNNRTEYAYSSTQQQTCVKSFFPHQGLEPCWYARRHTDRPIKI
jgi:hypothetical protein